MDGARFFRKFELIEYAAGPQGNPRTLPVVGPECCARGYDDGARWKKRKTPTSKSADSRRGRAANGANSHCPRRSRVLSTRWRVSRRSRDDHGPCRPVCFPPPHLLKYTMAFLRFSDPKNCLCSPSSHLPARTETGRVIMYRPTHTSIMCLRKLFG